MKKLLVTIFLSVGIILLGGDSQLYAHISWEHTCYSILHKMDAPIRDLIRHDAENLQSNTTNRRFWDRLDISDNEEDEYKQYINRKTATNHHNLNALFDAMFEKGNPAFIKDPLNFFGEHPGSNSCQYLYIVIQVFRI